MKLFRLVFIALFSVVVAASACEKPAVTPDPITLDDFYGEWQSIYDFGPAAVGGSDLDIYVWKFYEDTLSAYYLTPATSSKSVVWVGSLQIDSFLSWNEVLLSWTPEYAMDDSVKLKVTGQNDPLPMGIRLHPGDCFEVFQGPDGSMPPLRFVMK